MKTSISGLFAILALACTSFAAQAAEPAAQPDRSGEHLRATSSPLHFKPAIESATNEQCLACHQEILDNKPLAESPAGVKASESLAWYQRVATYTGEQESFHRRHLVTPLAKELMNLKCNTCHQGHDPREEAQGSSATGASQNDVGFTLRKQVNPETTCLKCHGADSDPAIMGLPAPWEESKTMFQNDCLICHVAFRTSRHKVNYLNAEAIEARAIKDKENGTGGDTCFGCHGGRSWYRIAYPYPRNAWPGMPTDMPDWARDRPTQSEARFLKTEQAK